MRAIYVAGRGDNTDSTGGLFRFERSDSGWSGHKVADVQQLSSLTRHPHLPVVYGTSGIGDNGRIHAWAIEADGLRTTELRNADSGGAEPCFASVHPTGRLLIVANYTTGTLATWPLDDTGTPIGDPRLTALGGLGSGVEPDRQAAPHPHQAVVVGDRLLVPDLGSDLIRSYRMDESGIGEQLDALPVPPGTGPRHAAVAQDGTIAVSGELSQIVAFPFRGDVTVIPSTRATGTARSRSPRNYPGDLKIGPKAGYVANRGHDTIGVFTLGAEPELIAEVQSGVRWPQHLIVDDGELLVAGWDSSQVASLPLGEDGVPGEPQILFECPGAAWLLPVPQLSM